MFVFTEFTSTCMKPVRFFVVTRGCKLLTHSSIATHDKAVSPHVLGRLPKHVGTLLSTQACRGPVSVCHRQMSFAAFLCPHCRAKHQEEVKQAIASACLCDRCSQYARYMWQRWQCCAVLAGSNFWSITPNFSNSTLCMMIQVLLPG